LFDYYITISAELQKKSIFAQQIKADLTTIAFQQLDLKAIEKNIVLLLGISNYLLGYFLDSLAARETLTKVYEESE